MTISYVRLWPLALAPQLDSLCNEQHRHRLGFKPCQACAAGSEWSYCEETWWFFVGTDMSLPLGQYCG